MGVEDIDEVSISLFIISKFALLLVAIKLFLEALLVNNYLD